MLEALRACQPIGLIYYQVEDNIEGPLKMPTKLKDTLEKVTKLDNKSNSDLLIEFYEY
jgi:hypothetical protein